MTLVGFNILVLGALLILLLAEEVRYRRFSQRLRNVRADLLALSYRLRTPLSTIRKYNDFLRGGNVGKLSMGQVESLSKIELATQDAVIGLNRLLRASRLDEAVLAENVATVNLREIVDGGLHAMSALIEERKHTVSTDASVRPMNVRGDPLLLHGIVDEILLNAVAYTKEKGKITVHVAKEKKNIVVTVKDTGIGIPPADQPHIFEQFFRGQLARTMYQGNGLGLAFAKRFAEQAGGRLRFTSVAGKGSTFTLTLPAR